MFGVGFLFEMELEQGCLGCFGSIIMEKMYELSTVVVPGVYLVIRCLKHDGRYSLVLILWISLFILNGS